MPRVTVAQLLERIEALEAEVEALKVAPPTPSVSYYVEVPARKMGGPLDFKAMAKEQGEEYAYADPEWWGYGVYL